MNNMKLYIVGMVLAVMSLTACTAGFLDVESKKESTTGNFFRTESDAWRALIGCYDGCSVLRPVRHVPFILLRKSWRTSVLPVWEILTLVTIR